MAESHLATLEAEFYSKSTRLEELEREKGGFEGKILDLKERLARAEGKVFELEESNIRLNTARDKVIAQTISTLEELTYCKSDNFKKNIIDEFKSSGEYDSDMRKEASSYLDKGCVHIIRQHHHHFQD